jgi:hypothetical protein
MRPSTALIAVLMALWSGSLCQAAAPPAEDVQKLINELANVSAVGVGYSTLSSGWQFLPHADSEELHTLVLGSPSPRKSAVLEKLVRVGARAVPRLLKHLDDDQETRIPPIKGMMWMEFIDRHDVNRRTRKATPTKPDMAKSRKPAPDKHHLTVGDLSYVALGQIVNRQFTASRYQPTGGLIVASPTHSRRLCEVIRGEFKDFTEEKHKQLLRSDFKSPDYEGRRIGAYRRLAFYYPGEVEKLVLAQLAVPTYDVFAVERFVREKLYRETSVEKQQSLFKEFVSDHGKAASDGILLRLFDDLDLQEANEKGRLHPPLKEKQNPRSLLIELFAYPRKIKSTDRPYVTTWAATERVRFLQALIHDKSTKVDEAVLELLRASGTDKDLADACIARLNGRGYDEIIRRTRKRDRGDR